MQKASTLHKLTLSLPARSTKWNFELVMIQSPSSAFEVALDLAVVDSRCCCLDCCSLDVTGLAALLDCGDEGTHLSCFSVTEKIA